MSRAVPDEKSSKYPRTVKTGTSMADRSGRRADQYSSSCGCVQPLDEPRRWLGAERRRDRECADVEGERTAPLVLAGELRAPERDEGQPEAAPLVGPPLVGIGAAHHGRHAAQRRRAPRALRRAAPAPGRRSRRSPPGRRRRAGGRPTRPRPRRRDPRPRTARSDRPTRLGRGSPGRRRRSPGGRTRPDGAGPAWRRRPGRRGVAGGAPATAHPRRGATRRPRGGTPSSARALSPTSRTTSSVHRRHRLVVPHRGSGTSPSRTVQGRETRRKRCGGRMTGASIGREGDSLRIFDLLTDGANRTPERRRAPLGGAGPEPQLRGGRAHHGTRRGRAGDARSRPGRPGRRSSPTTASTTSRRCSGPGASAPSARW